MKKVIINGYDGFVYQSSSEYLEQVETILNNNNLHNFMANNARKVAERYSEKNFGRQVEDIYLNQLLESGIFMAGQENYYSTFNN